MKTSPTLNHFTRQTVIAAVLILLFAYAAVSKLLDYDNFQGQLYNQAIPRALAGPLTWLLPAAELLTCVLLSSRRGQHLGLQFSLALLSVFTVYTGLVLLGFWDRVPCSCGGILSHMSWGFHLGFNIFFLAITVWALCPARAVHAAYRHGTAAGNRG
jgi:putative oxidoreductase